MTGRVEDFKARHVARATRAVGLTLDQARQVDTDCVDALVGLAWGRAMDVVEAAVIAADPAGHERRRAAAEAERCVATSRRDTTTGLRTLIARTTAGDIARLDAMVAHLAEVLGLHGDTDELQVRRAQAIAILADPAAACLRIPRHVPATTPGRQPSVEPVPSTPPGGRVRPAPLVPHQPTRAASGRLAPRPAPGWPGRRCSAR